MIKNTIDFNYAIDKITTQTNTNIYLQSNTLNSDYINKSFSEIENSLNSLYEKTRYLEDSIEYTKAFLNTKINDFDKELNSILHEIENTADSAKNLSYISYNVPFVINTNHILDRDNITKINPLTLKNNKLMLDYNINIDQEYKTCSRICDSIPYKDNLTSIKSEPYRTVYLEEKLIPNGLTETIVISFGQPTEVNLIDAKFINCNMKNIRFGLINGTVEEITGDYSLEINQKTRICTYIKFDLVCTNYDLVTYELDKSKITSNVWSEVQEFEYNQMNNISNKFDASMIISKTTQNKNTGKKNTITYSSSENKNITTLKMYSYVFGLDYLNIKNNEFYKDGYMISDPITIGKLKEEEFIRLNVKHNYNENSAIEYSVLDGDIEIPLALINEDTIKNELIFSNCDTRFIMDFDASTSYSGEIIKQNGIALNLSYLDAKTKVGTDNNRYSVSYKTGVENYNYKPLNDTIRIKCYIRTFGTIKDMPYISSIAIHKYGEESLWINRF